MVVRGKHKSARGGFKRRASAEGVRSLQSDKISDGLADLNPVARLDSVVKKSRLRRAQNLRGVKMPGDRAPGRTRRRSADEFARLKKVKDLLGVFFVWCFADIALSAPFYGGGERRRRNIFVGELPREFEPGIDPGFFKGAGVFHFGDEHGFRLDVVGEVLIFGHELRKGEDVFERVVVAVQVQDDVGVVGERGDGESVRLQGGGGCLSLEPFFCFAEDEPAVARGVAREFFVEAVVILRDEFVEVGPLSVVVGA